jgi:hypothetical protein
MRTCFRPDWRRRSDAVALPTPRDPIKASSSSRSLVLPGVTDILQDKNDILIECAVDVHPEAGIAIFIRLAPRLVLVRKLEPGLHWLSAPARR